jgi:hypothetical protein
MKEMKSSTFWIMPPSMHRTDAVFFVSRFVGILWTQHTNAHWRPGINDQIAARFQIKPHPIHVAKDAFEFWLTPILSGDVIVVLRFPKSKLRPF